MGLFGKPDPRPAQEPVPLPPAAAPAPAPVSHARATAPSKSTVLGEKTRYSGKIDTDEPLLIQGSFEGEIKSSSEVEIGETGVVTAAITARQVVISGRVNGDCTASDKVEIRASGKLTGGIHAARIVIAEGAEFKGTSQMASNPRS